MWPGGSIIFFVPHHPHRFLATLGMTDGYFFPFFFFDVAAVAVVAAFGFAATPPPSTSERLSSISTVWVMASVPLVGAGFAAAGAIVCVVACGAVESLRVLQPAKSAATSRKRIAFFT